MSKSATIPAVNGQAESDDRPGRLAALRDTEAKALIRLACDVFHETSDVAHQLHTAIFTGDSAASADELVRQVVDTLICLQTIDHYLRMLRDVLAEQAIGPVDRWTAEPAS